jgi:glyoxylase-like metal-dependent hydrolase (beta-lactamase superfamily II)
MKKEELVFEQLNPDACRTYLIGAPETKEAALVDPVLGSTEEYLRVLKKGGWSLRYVIDTHTHADHLSGVPVQRTGASTRCTGRRAQARVAPFVRRVDAFARQDDPREHRDSATPGTASTPEASGRLLAGDFSSSAGRTHGSSRRGSGEHWESLNRVILVDGHPHLPGHDYQGSGSRFCGRRSAPTRTSSPAGGKSTTPGFPRCEKAHPGVDDRDGSRQ